MIRKNNRKIISSTVLFASAPVLALQAFGEKNVVPIQSASKGLDLLGKQTFLQDAPKTNNISVDTVKIFSYVGIVAIVFFALYWTICIANNRKLLKNYANDYFNKAKNYLSLADRCNLNTKAEIERLSESIKTSERILPIREEELQQIQRHSKELEKMETEYPRSLENISKEIERNIEIKNIFVRKDTIVCLEKNIKENSKELKEKLEFFNNFGLNFNCDELVAKVVEEAAADRSFENFIETKIKGPIKNLQDNIELEAREMLQGFEIKMLKKGISINFLEHEPNEIDNSVFDFTEVDTEKTFQSNKEMKGKFEEKVNEYRKLWDLFYSDTGVYYKIETCLGNIYKSALKKKGLEKTAGTATVEDFLKGAIELINRFNLFFIHYKDEEFHSFCGKLKGKMENFKIEKHKIGEFHPEGVLFDYNELEELKKYVNKKILDFKKDKEETNEKISDLSAKISSLKKTIKENKELLNIVRVENLEPLEKKVEFCSKQVEFYSKQKEKLEKDWWKPWIYKFEEYKENN